jgi:hypothetical protein
MQFHESVTTPRATGAGTRPSGDEAPRSRGVRSWTRSRTGALAIVLLVAGGTAACSSSDGGEAKTAAASPTTSASSAAPSASPSPSPTGGGPTPTPGPSVIPKVSRPGQPTKPTVSAGRATFEAPVAYPDGVTLKVQNVVPGVETGEGPGVFAGREFAVFTVTMHNGTTKPIDAQSVVVTSTYGKRGLVAERVYAADTDAVDFGGQIAPGADATARYAFAVPTKQLGDVRLVVDFDGTHTSAEFDGDARKAS